MKNMIERPVRRDRPAPRTVERRPQLQILQSGDDTPRRSLKRELKRAVGWALRLFVLSIAAVIIGIWVHNGGITGVRDTGTLLTSAGRLTGLLGSYALLIQVLLLARLPFLEWVVPFDRLTSLHRTVGKLCLYLILAHVGLITAGYALLDKISIPAQFLQFLTSFTGMVTATVGTVMIVVVAVSSLVLARRHLRYETWYLVHLMAYVGVLLTWFHQIPTGADLFANPVAVAFWTALYLVTLQLVIFFRVAQPVARTLWHGMRVVEVIPEGPGVVSLLITGRHLDWINARAGQFFLWRFLSRELWQESHPFSLSAAPDGQSLRITIKALGDFSARLAHIKTGTRVIAEGPFGHFTEEAQVRSRSVLIAGGIGITPIRALLQDLRGDVVLIYRAVHEGEIIFRPELDALAKERHIAVHYVVGDHRAPHARNYLSAEHLRELVPNIASREIYLCGPSPMMRAVRGSLHSLHIPQQFIHTDEFAF